MKKDIKNNVKLSIGILVSNRIQYIRKVMESLKPLLEAVPSELVVIDTKGIETDGSVDIAREYTDKIYPFTWCNDFSAARNFCMEHTTGEWFFFLDDDEWFEDVQELIEFFRTGECECYRSGLFYIRNYRADNSYSTGINVRMVRRTTETRFVGVVHERFHKVEEPKKYFSCEIHHMGYVYVDKMAEKKHQERNVTLMKEAIKQEGQTPKNCAQLVQEYLSVEDTAAEGMEFAKQSIALWIGRPEQKTASAQWILTVIARQLAKEEKYEELLCWVEQVHENYWCSILADLVYALLIAEAAVKKEDYLRVLQNTKRFLECRDWLMEHEEEKNSMLQLDFPVFLEEKFYFYALHMGAFSANQRKEYQCAMEYWNRFPWKREDLDKKLYEAELMRTVQGIRMEAQNKEKEGKIKLTIGILISNRKQYIRKVMESIKPLLDAVPSELIAVDTKGKESDGSIDIVREYTDKIYPFTWCNDFSAARNVCLEHARGEWFLYLDDDEWFEDVQEFIDFFQSREYENYGAGYYLQRNYFVDGGKKDAIVGRMIRRTSDTRFVGRIHERFNLVQEPFKEFSCYVHHYGYCFTTEEEKEMHQKRNMELLEQELKENGMTPRICAELMQEFLSRKATAEEGYQFFLTSIQELEKKNMLADSCTQWMLVTSVRYFKIVNNYEGLLKQARIIKENYQLSQVAQMALAGVVIEASAPKGNVQAILEYAPMYKEAWNWMKTHQAEVVSQKQLDFPNYISWNYAIQVFQAAATCANAVKDYRGAYEYWQQLPWEDKNFDGNQYLKGMKETLDGLEQEQNGGQVEERVVYPELIKSDIKLTIGMLVSNHVQYIRKAMEALRPLLETVPSELVVIDTEGAESDGSIDIVREYTDKIYPFTWCNDFSAARNFCLDHSQGEWFLYVDDDEWFDDVQEFVDFFQNGECENYYSGFYYTHDYTSEDTYAIAIAGRMIRRTVNTRFVGKVHETFNEVYGPNKKFSCFTHHMGYMMVDEVARKNKQKRNLSLLLEELQEKGYQPRICAQIVQELLFVQDTREKGFEFACEYIGRLQKQGLLHVPSSQWILTVPVRYLATRREYVAMLKQAEFIQKNYELSQMALLVISTIVAEEAAAWQDTESASKYANIYLEQWNWLNAHDEEALLQTSLDFPKYYTKEKYEEMLQLQN